jgi:5-methylthioribose kinase
MLKKLVKNLENKRQDLTVQIKKLKKKQAFLSASEKIGKGLLIGGSAFAATFGFMIAMTDALIMGTTAAVVGAGQFFVSRYYDKKNNIVLNNAENELNKVNDKISGQVAEEIKGNIAESNPEKEITNKPVVEEKSEIIQKQP